MQPLSNRRILITRARGQASPLSAQLDLLGATTLLIPTIELAPPASWSALDAALLNLRSFDLLAFTSANAVHAYAARAHQLDLPPHPRRIAVIGPATAAAVRAAGLTPDDPDFLVPSTYVAESLAETILQSLHPYVAGTEILLPRAAAARDHLPETLTAAGVRVTCADTYQTLIPPHSVAALTTLFRTQPPDAITFTSASTAQNLAALLEAAHLTLPREIVLASIGPVTSATLRALDMGPTCEASESTIPALVQAIEKHFAAHEVQT